MAQDATQIRTAANGNIWVAPVGTAAPANETASYGSGWVDLGFASEDGVKFKDGKTTRDQTVWQSFYPVGKKILTRSSTLTIVLKQWNKTTVTLAFGGGSVTTVSSGHYKYSPPTPETVDYRAMGIDWIEGSLLYRLIIPRGEVTEDVEVQLARTDDAMLPIGFEALPTDSTTLPWYMLTNDPAWA